MKSDGPKLYPVHGPKVFRIDFYPEDRIKLARCIRRLELLEKVILESGLFFETTPKAVNESKEFLKEILVRVPIT